MQGGVMFQNPDREEWMVMVNATLVILVAVTVIIVVAEWLARLMG
jgi:hypothetical protein